MFLSLLFSTVTNKYRNHRRFIYSLKKFIGFICMEDRYQQSDKDHQIELRSL